jgi:protein subunit release factor B
MVAGGALGLLDACGGAGGQEAQRLADEARRRVNLYCDARAKAIEALGTGEAGAQN